MNKPRVALSVVMLPATLVAGTACGGEDPAPSPTPATFSAHARVVMDFMTMGDDLKALDAYCGQKFAAVAGTQVPIKGPSGSLVGYGVLASAPTTDTADGTCTITWDATDILETTDVLSYQIGRYEPMLFKQAEADSLALSVPDEGEGYQVGVG